jgi:hypothetical protein
LSVARARLWTETRGNRGLACRRARPSACRYNIPTKAGNSAVLLRRALDLAFVLACPPVPFQATRGTPAPLKYPLPSQRYLDRSFPQPQPAATGDASAHPLDLHLPWTRLQADPMADNGRASIPLKSWMDGWIEALLPTPIWVCNCFKGYATSITMSVMSSCAGDADCQLRTSVSR